MQPQLQIYFRLLTYLLIGRFLTLSLRVRWITLSEDPKDLRLLFHKTIVNELIPRFSKKTNEYHINHKNDNVMNHKTNTNMA